MIIFLHLYRFNSTLVQLKGSSQEFKFRYCNSFNSTLVQLKV